MISQELIAALDDLIQAGAQASAALRETLERMSGPAGQMNAVAAAQGVIDNVKSAVRTEQTMPTLITAARDAVEKLQNVAHSIGSSDLAGALRTKVDAFTAQMKASGLGTPWLTIIGLGAGAIAAWYFWKQYNKKKSIASFEYPEPDADDIRPRLRGMSKSLGALRSSFGAPSSCRQLGRGKRLGNAEKYEFEPESRLEGLRGSRRRRNK